jgi:hypothetical protein
VENDDLRRQLKSQSKLPKESLSLSDVSIQTDVAIESLSNPIGSSSLVQRLNAQNRKLEAELAAADSGCKVDTDQMPILDVEVNVQMVSTSIQILILF